MRCLILVSALAMLASALFITARAAPSINGRRGNIDPLQEEILRMKNLGFKVKQRQAYRFGDNANSMSRARAEQLVAIIFTQWKGRFDRLQIYQVERRSATLIYTYPGMNKRLDFDSEGHRSALQADGRDGSVVIAFFTSPGSTPGSTRESHKLRYQSGRILVEFQRRPE